MRGVEGAIFRGMSTYFSTDMTVVKILHIGGEQNWTKYMGGGIKMYFAWFFAGFTFHFRHKLRSRKRQQQTGSSLCYSHSLFA